MSKGYLVTHLRYEKGQRSGEAPVESQIVLRDVHPLVWASHPPAVFRKNLFNVIKSWQEFDCPDHLWVAIEDGNVLCTDSLASMIAGAEEDGDSELLEALRKYATAEVSE